MFGKYPHYLGFLALFLLFSACSSIQPKVSSDSMRESDLTSSPPPAVSPKTIGEQNFESRWKENYEKTLSELDRNHQKWRNKNSANYDFIIAKDAPGNTSEWIRLPVLIKVRNDRTISIDKVEKDKENVIYSRTDGFEDFDSIDRLFDFIRRELNSGKIFEVDYDEDFGYPKKVVETMHCCVNHNYRIIIISKFETIKVNPDNKKL